jgi:hypothetical protein
MVRTVQWPVVGQIARYEGTYRPHWEIGHIAVRVARVRKLLAGAVAGLGLFGAFWIGFCGPIEAAVLGGVLVLLLGTPAEEWWSPSFPPGYEGGLEGEGGPIEFEGIVTRRGWYGHKGIMRRRVEIIRIIKYLPR